MYPARSSSSTRPSHSLRPGVTPMLIAAPRTSTYGAGCPKICLRMCFNIRRALLLMSIPLSSRITGHSAAEHPTHPTPPGPSLCALLLSSELPLYGVLRSSGTLGLAQEVPWIVGVPPVLHYLAVGHAEHVHGLDLHPLACGSDPLELSAVGAAHGDAGRHPVPFGHHVLDGDAEVGEALSGLGEGLLEGVDELGGRVVRQ